MNDFFVRFLTRPGCHLCDEARPTIERAARIARARVETVDITGDPETEVRWDLRIPVVLDARGRVLAEGRIGAGRLTRKMLRARFGH